MVLVRGHDTYSALQITTKPATDDWATIASVPAWLTVPILSESLVVKPAAFPKSQELGNVGAAGSISQGRQFVEGEFTVYPRYNAPWFWKLIGNAMGGMEERTADETVAGDTVALSVMSTHAWTPQSYQCATAGSESAVAGGLSMRVWKSGASATAGYIDTFAGVTVTGFTWNQPEDDLATVTFRVLATAPTSPSASTGTFTAAVASNQVKVRDLSRTAYGFAPSVVKVGQGASDSVPTTHNIRSFSITVEGNYEIGAAPMTSPDEISKPGHADGWSITGEYTGLVEDTLADSTQPYKDFVDGTLSALHIRYASEEICDSTVEDIHYAVDLLMAGILLTSAEATTANGGALATRYGFEAYRHGLSAAVAAAADNWSVALLVQAHLSDTDDTSAVVLTASHGGNDLTADMDE